MGVNDVVHDFLFIGCYFRSGSSRSLQVQRQWYFLVAFVNVSKVVFLIGLMSDISSELSFAPKYNLLVANISVLLISVVAMS